MSSVVYFLRGRPSGLIKIGWSANIERRVANLTGLSPERLEILATVKGGRVLEEHLHEHFAADRVHGEWFAPSAHLLAFIDQVLRLGEACLPLGFLADAIEAKRCGKHSISAVNERARLLAVRARSALERQGASRMEAYAIVARDIGTSVTWVRRLIGRQQDFVLHAHVFLNLSDLADRLDRSSSTSNRREVIAATT